MDAPPSDRGRLTPAPIEVRRARLEDAHALAVLSSQLGYPVSSSVLTEQRYLEASTRCELLGLVVDLEHRRRGVGQQLVAAMERWALGRGLTEISVRSNVVRAESHPFYERLGYQRTKTQHVYRKPLSAG